MLPTFIIIGAMKSGTTSLASYLGAHPDVFMSSPKEPNFFSRRWDKRGEELLPWYEGLFQDSSGIPCRGEASVSYTMAPAFEGVPARIARIVPDARLVYLIRNPVDRIRSMYVNEVGNGDTELSLSESLDQDPRYLEISRYAAQAELYLEHFARDQLLIVSSERLRDDRARVVRKVLDFIGADSGIELDLQFELKQASAWRRLPRLIESPVSILRNTGALGRISKPTKRRLRRLVGREISVAVPREVERRIWNALEPDLQRLRALVGPDFDLWGHA
jgi:hypothetical protein